MDSKVEINFDIKLTKGQKKAYDLVHDDIRYLILRWSRQSGKSVFAEIILMEYLCQKNTFSAYISPTFQLGRKVYNEISKMLEPTGIIKKSNSSTLTIETIFNSTLQFFSAQAYTAIRGNTVSGILIIDEAAYIGDILPNGENFWGNVVMPICKARKPKVIMISTPCGKQGFFYDFYLRAMNNEDGIKELTRTIYDDDLVTEEEIEEIRKNIPPKAFEQEFECKFLDSSLTFFEGFENCFTKFKYVDGREWIGVDISGNGNDETIVTKINSINQVKQYKIEGALDVKYQKIANIINESNNCVGVYMENNGLGLPIINEVRKLVNNKSKIHEFTTTNKSKEEIISNLAVIIANKDIYFNEDDTELYSQFGTFISKISKSKKLTFGAQEGKLDDRIMSLAICLQAKNELKYYGGKSTVFLPSMEKIIR